MKVFSLGLIVLSLLVSCTKEKTEEEYEFVEWAELNYYVDINP